MNAQPPPPRGPRPVVFALVGLGALLLALPVAVWLGRPDADALPADRLGSVIGCSCGTCPMRPIATCGCGFADGMLARLQTELDAGRSDDEIMAIFVAEYGPGISIKPQTGGFDLFAWFAPMALLMVGAVAMAAIISRWRSEQLDRQAAADDDSQSVGDTVAEPAQRSRRAADAGYREIVEQELDAFDA